MNKIVEWNLPNLRTVSEANIREHWNSKKKKKRHEDQKTLVNWAFISSRIGLPDKCHIVLTRIAPRKMDYDNLVSSFKHIRDYIAACIHPESVIFAKSKSGKIYSNPGHCDRGDSITWDYTQEKGKPKEYGVKISIYDMPMTIHDPRND